MNKLFGAGPLSGSNYHAGLGEVAGLQLVAINYETGVYRWRPIAADGSLLLDAEHVFGTNVDPGCACEIAADDHVRADIARTLPPP